jgi:AAA+ superfamily predicted ATPase
MLGHDADRMSFSLFGPPGVGKTMSAEATSEHVRKPLYVVGAGDLGTKPHELDQKLDEIFDIAHVWGAVVLIDEADVFLEARSVHDLERNALVAVFLRQLEYFAGILFLTTNRIKTFDEAFQSRIHISLRYTDLEGSSRRLIWRAFLTKVGVVDGVSQEQWDTLAETKVNGRQIKNAVRTAQALAASTDSPLGFTHIAQVLSVMAQFEEDMKTI